MPQHYFTGKRAYFHFTWYLDPNFLWMFKAALIFAFVLVMSLCIPHGTFKFKSLNSQLKSSIKAHLIFGLCSFTITFSRAEERAGRWLNNGFIFGSCSLQPPHATRLHHLHTWTPRVSCDTTGAHALKSRFSGQSVLNETQVDAEIWRELHFIRSDFHMMSDDNVDASLDTVWICQEEFVLEA